MKTLKYIILKSIQTVLSQPVWKGLCRLLPAPTRLLPSRTHRQALDFPRSILPQVAPASGAACRVRASRPSPPCCKCLKDHLGPTQGFNDVTRTTVLELFTQKIAVLRLTSRQIANSYDWLMLQANCAYASRCYQSKASRQENCLVN